MIRRKLVGAIGGAVDSECSLFNEYQPHLLQRCTSECFFWNHHSLIKQRYYNQIATHVARS
jgi:hypothetical protein